MSSEANEHERIIGSGRRVLAVCLLLLAIGSAPIFLRSFLNDEVTYLLVGQKLASGGLLYRDAVDNKPPLIYATFALVYSLFGRASVVAVKVLSIGINAACAALLFLIGRRLFGGRVGALAAVLFSAAAVSGVAEDFAAPNTEGFMNLFVLAALALLARDPERPGRPALVAAGVLIGLASLYRLQGAAALPASLAFFFWRLGRRPSRPRFVAVAASMIAGFLLPLAGAALFFAARGTWSDFWLWAVRNNVTYVQAGNANAGWRTVARIALIAACQLPWLAAAIAAGGASLRAREPERTRALLVWLHLAAALVAYQAGTRFYGHYFLQAVPFVSLMAAWGLANGPRARLPWLRFVPRAAGVWVLGFAVVNGARLSGPAPGDGDGAAEVVALVKAETARDDEIFLWSAPLQIAWESGRRFATRFVFDNYLTGRIFGTAHNRPGASRETNRALESADGWRLLEQDLAAARPAFVVDARTPGFELRRYPLLEDYLDRFFAPAIRVGRFDVYRRAPSVPAARVSAITALD